MPGKVFLVGAGPGDPELLTLKALKVLRNADVVLHDDLVSAEILKLVPATAKIQNIGKRCGRKGITQQEINALLVNYALLDLQVVRLKGGDPLVFGRAGEEMEALRSARIEFEIVPGITAAFGAAAAAQIPLTHRDASSALVLITNHQANHPSTHNKSDWPTSLPCKCHHSGLHAGLWIRGDRAKVNSVWTGRRYAVRDYFPRHRRRPAGISDQYSGFSKCAASSRSHLASGRGSSAFCQ